MGSVPPRPMAEHAIGHGMQEVMPSPTRVPRCLDRPSLPARVPRPVIVARPSHSGLVTRTLACFPRALAWFLGLGLVPHALAWFSSPKAWFPWPWLGFHCLGRVSSCLGLVFLGHGLGFLVPWLGFTLPRLGFSNVGLVSPHVVVFLARASAKRCAYLKNYDR